MPGGSRAGGDAALLSALVGGSHLASAAASAGMSERTARRRMLDPDFRRQLDAAQAELVSGGVRALTAATADAVLALHDLVAPSSPPGIRLHAAKAILEIGSRLREEGEVLERLTAVEQALDAARR
jgi:hypothetical protein